MTDPLQVPPELRGRLIDIDREDFDRIAVADIPGCRPGVMAPRIRTIIQLGLEALQTGETNA